MAAQGMGKREASDKERILDMATTVLIPARNEALTIGPIVALFKKHPETRGLVFVALDSETWDGTSQITLRNGGIPVETGVHGKGEVVAQAVRILRSVSNYALSERIILCDADYRHFSSDHIDRILECPRGMTIGVPDYPEIPVPDHVTRSWPLVSGFRYLPVSLIPENAHGYLLETQVNLRALKSGNIIKRVRMPGLVSPFQWPLSRRRELARRNDAKWGKEHGIL